MFQNTFRTEQLRVTASVIASLKEVIKHIAKYDSSDTFTFKLYENIVRNSQPYISIMKSFSKFTRKYWLILVPVVGVLQLYYKTSQSQLFSSKFS